MVPTSRWCLYGRITPIYLAAIVYDVYTGVRPVSPAVNHREAQSALQLPVHWRGLHYLAMKRAAIIHRFAAKSSTSLSCYSTRTR